MDPISMKDIRGHTPWSARSYERRYISEQLGEELEMWIRAKAMTDITDDAMRDMLIEQSGVRISIDTMRNWRRDLGYRKRRPTLTRKRAN